jgi:hypothetical protein
MLTLTTNELQALVVAAPGPDSCAIPAVAEHRARSMRDGAVAYARSEHRTKPAVFGTWNRPRRLVGFVT